MELLIVEYTFRYKINKICFFSQAYILIGKFIIWKFMSNTDKERAIAAALAQIEKSYGKGSVMKLGQRPNVDIKPYQPAHLGLI